MSTLSSRFRKLRRRCGLLFCVIYKVFYLFWFRLKRYWGNLFVFLRGCFHKSDLSKIKNYTDLIICAHPDDETIFFSGVIKERKPFVVCMSHRGDPVRQKEFYQALAYWGLDGCMFNMIDVYRRYNWAWESHIIDIPLKKIAKHCPKLERVYTHNIKGESDHRHHHGLGTAVGRIFKDYKIYMTAESLPEPTEAANPMYEEKCSILTQLYPSQYKWLAKGCDWFTRYLSQEEYQPFSPPEQPVTDTRIS